MLGAGFDVGNHLLPTRAFLEGFSVSKMPKKSVSDFSQPVVYTDEELSMLVHLDFKMIEMLLEKRHVTLSRLKKIQTATKMNLLLEFVSLDPSSIERLLERDILSLKDLLHITFRPLGSTKKEKFDLFMFLLNEDPSMLGRLLDKGIIYESDLPFILLRNGSTLMHFYASRFPEKLTQLIVEQHLHPQFIGLMQVRDWPPVLTILAVSDRLEILKWIVDYEWFSLEKCQQKAVFSYAGKSVASVYEETHKTPLINAVRCYHFNKSLSLMR